MWPHTNLEVHMKPAPASARNLPLFLGGQLETKQNATEGRSPRFARGGARCGHRDDRFVDRALQARQCAVLVAEQRIRAEARALARLSHPNVVQLHELREHAGELLLVMEHVQGAPLGAWLRQNPARPWRPVLAAGLIAGSWLAAACGGLRGRALLLALLLPPLLAPPLLAGGFAGLTSVPTELWGGLPLTLLLTGAGMAGALPIGIAVAYGRRSSLPLLRGLLTAYVELARGIPLVAALFIASFLLPLFFPQGVAVDMLWRVLIAIVLFAAAYLSEIVRGGLQAFPAGQVDAASALGFSPWQTQRWIVLPQVLRAVAPSLANSAIALFKDTSLVTIVSLYDLTGAVQLALGDADWRKFFIEGQLFAAAIYFVACFAMSRYSLWLEKHLNTGTRRQ